MDLSQSKLSRAEWETIEVPVSETEKQILLLIKKGFSDVSYHTNENQSMFSFVKIEKTPSIELFLFTKYFQPILETIVSKYCKKTPFKSVDSLFDQEYQKVEKDLKKQKLKQADVIRLQNLDANINLNKSSIFEFTLLDLTYQLLRNISKNKKKYAFYLYTILQLKKASIHDINKHLLYAINTFLDYANKMTNTAEIITNAYDFIEKNRYLMKYEDRVLFTHQKELFRLFQNSTRPNLVLYTAPTGTGKTLSPIGLSEKYRIIFVCVARHIGLALAKSAISIEKKIAFAFGCETASDIRLHYFSAIDYTKNRRSGRIERVNNAIGDNVEIMICDVQSYTTAMHYMLAFNEADNIITYWDEPTITLDSVEHDLHAIIHRNWVENKIPNMVLSCATLPTANDLQPIFDDFRDKFDNAEITTITSFDCRKSIPIMNKDGFSVLPHYMYPEYEDLTRCVMYCNENKTLLRYFDLREIVRFIDYIMNEDFVKDEYNIDSYFQREIQRITMNSLKEYYLELLLHIDESDWTQIYNYMGQTRKPKYLFVSGGSAATIQKTKSVDYHPSSFSSSFEGKPITKSNSIAGIPTRPTPDPLSGIRLTTNDAYSLSDGPTIFLVEDVVKIGTFYIQQSKIAPSVLQNILSKIIQNDKLMKRIDSLEETITAKETKQSSNDNETKSESKKDSGRLSNESEKMMDEINILRQEIQLVSLDSKYKPNTQEHQLLWTPDKEIHENAFMANIGEETAKEIMMLDVDNNLKVLLLLGIGMFIDTTSSGTTSNPTMQPNVRYMEIMKQLAEKQHLFIIIASSDYIYGTNYQFCHGFIGKDLKNMTQQKTLQAMGRIGRNNIQQDYTIRFRDDEMIMRLFEKPECNLEAENLCRLFTS